MKRVMEALSIEEAFCNGLCPYCGRAVDSVDKHLKRCRGKKKAIEAMEALKKESARWVIHEDCGRCMILDIRDGLALIENSARRYVVPASDLKGGEVAKILGTIVGSNLAEDQIRELVGHLLSMIKNIQIQPAIRRGNRVEFMHQGRIVAGEVQRRHGQNSFIVKSGTLTINISKNDVIGIIE